MVKRMRLEPPSPPRPLEAPFGMEGFEGRPTSYDALVAERDDLAAQLRTLEAEKAAWGRGADEQVPDAKGSVLSTGTRASRNVQHSRALSTSVSCGGHQADSCAECPQGNGAASLAALPAGGQ